MCVVVFGHGFESPGVIPSDCCLGCSVQLADVVGGGHQGRFNARLFQAPQ